MASMRSPLRGVRRHAAGQRDRAGGRPARRGADRDRRRRRRRLSVRQIASPTAEPRRRPQPPAGSGERLARALLPPCVLGGAARGGQERRPDRQRGGNDSWAAGCAVGNAADRRPATLCGIRIESTACEYGWRGMTAARARSTLAEAHDHDLRTGTRSRPGRGDAHVRDRATRAARAPSTIAWTTRRAPTSPRRDQQPRPPASARDPDALAPAAELVRCRRPSGARASPGRAAQAPSSLTGRRREPPALTQGDRPRSVTPIVWRGAASRTGPGRPFARGRGRGAAPTVALVMSRPSSVIRPSA